MLTAYSIIVGAVLIIYDDYEIDPINLAAADERSTHIDMPLLARDASIPAVLVKSKDVPHFDQYSSSFTTLYPMTCGGSVNVASTDGKARCMPDMNDLIELRSDDDLTAEFCMRVMVCKPGKGNSLCETDSIRLWFPYGRKLVDGKSVKEYLKASIEVKKGEIVVNVDPGCMLKLNKEHLMRHRFLNKPKGIREMMKKYPGFYLQPTFHHPRRLYRAGNTIFLGRSLQLGVNTRKMIDCYASCDEGQVFYYKMTANSPFYSKIFVDGAICEWMKVCIVGQQGVLSKKYYCRDADMVNVYVRNGFVVMPGAQNGAPIRLVKSTLGMTGTKTMSRRPTQIGFDYDGERFSIWSVGRERVASSQHVNHDGHIILYFSDHNCLIKKYGIMHLGENNGKVFQVDDKKPVDNVSKEKSGFVTYPTVAARSTLPTLGTEPPTPNASAVAPVTTTPARAIDGMLRPGIGEDVKKARSGWMIWAIFWGFLTGSLVAVIIGGLLLYFARRTAYADW
ncbi:hypothetical protein Y032_0058g2921 [Ancylostoma ceylanicum]|uniref:Uncharacterized protein n=1 Tax=Ancylostoma ceylanicum TaxID=53326 RepID=A0A016U3W7_9BILA|nr:hypothetical protein Y032_0058g2921 [Ancylostoma ceylanicum]